MSNEEAKIFKIKKVQKLTYTKTWDEKSDRILINYISKNLFTTKKWKKVSLLIKNKSPSQCYKRYKIVNPKFNKGRWSAEEDSLILMLIGTFGKNWSLISKSFKKRSSRQIKVRYENHLIPNIKKTKFNKDEDEIILNLYPKFKNNWSKYTPYLNGRASKKIKFRYISLAKKIRQNQKDKSKIFEIIKDE